MDLAILRLKKNEERRLQAGHVWIYSNEIDTKTSPLSNFAAGQTVTVQAYDKTPLGIAYVNPQSLITGRLLTRNMRENFDLALLTKRLQSAYEWRERFYPAPFYRLVFAESDGLPGLVVDRYGDHLAVQLNTAGMDANQELVITALQQVVPNVQSILLRNDSSARLQEGLTTYVAAGFGTPPEQIALTENGVNFTAPFLTGQKTGWFYDHRLNRSRLLDYVKNQRVLDVFSYLGGFGVQAAVFGAREVICVDASEPATQYILENARLNDVADKVQVICDDAFDALKALAKAQEKFDVIVLDPPAFVKKQKDKKAGLLAYQRINEAALKLLNAGGVLFSCSCSMQVEYTELLNAIRRAALSAHCPIQIVERGHQAADHPVHLAIPETDYLKMIVVRRI
ncbi:MAG: class I SAM-dependent rRNA methyltransferase [Pseudomonadota bacterium]